MGDKKPYVKPEVKNLGELHMKIIEANGKVIEGQQSLHNLIRGQAEEIRELKDRVAELEAKHAATTLGSITVNSGG
jgi:hypothetical protein